MYRWLQSRWWVPVSRRHSRGAGRVGAAAGNTGPALTGLQSHTMSCGVYLQSTAPLFFPELDASRCEG